MGWEMFFSILFGTVAVLLVIFGIYELILSAQALVPAGEYQGLIKLGVTLVMLMMFGGLTIVVSILSGAFFVFLGQAVGRLVGSLWNKMFR